jgi:hypothetical protein
LDVESPVDAENLFPNIAESKLQKSFPLIGIVYWRSHHVQGARRFSLGGAGLYILLFDRKWSEEPWLYVSAIVTAIVISPDFNLEYSE